MIYRIEIPGFAPARCRSQGAALAFWKFAAPSVVGRGLYAKLWTGERDEFGREVWTFTPQMIGIDEKEQTCARELGSSRPSPRSGALPTELI
jgi:hypothetical protein